MMNRFRLKPLHEQVVVILGASSGIGRESAIACAARGAKVVVAARSEPGLVSLVEAVRASGGEAAYAVCDVTDAHQVTAVADVAVATYGRIDTWVNSASVGVYAPFEHIALDEFRRVMDVNLMGYVHGARSALPHLRRAGRGALIFVASVESVVAMPLQSPYAASKHAIEGVADTLRRELQAEGVPISITSIKPAAIDTPFFTNALSKVGFRPKGPSPVYHPSVVAACVTYAAEHPVRDLYAGGAGRAIAIAQYLMPRALDAAIARFGVAAQRTDDPPGRSAVYSPRPEDNRVQGDFRGHAFRASPYTWLQLHPNVRRLSQAGIALAAGAISRRRR